MTIRLRHQLQEDGRVLITAGGDRPVFLHVPAAEAKRFAWAVLSDLDPEEAEEAGCPDSAVVQPVVGKGDKRAAWGSQTAGLAAVLAQGDADTATLARTLDISRNNASVLLCRLKAIGVVRMVKPGRPYSPAVWTLGDLPYADYVALRNGRLLLGREAA